MNTRSIVALLAAPAALVAQQPPVVGPPIRPLGAIEVASKETFGGALTLRHTPKGVLVNDVANRRLLQFDPTLSDFTVVADTTPATAGAYGRQASIIPYRGDSTLFVDAQSYSMLLIDPDGKVSRVMALPRSQDGMMLGTALGQPGFDKNGKLVYRGAPDFRRMMTRAMGGGPGGVPAMPEAPDTLPIVRLDLETRALDTLGYVKVQRPKTEVTRDEGTGRINVTMTVNPLATVDELAVTSNGDVAFIRGSDYHVDWVRSDGTRESSPKLPHPWQRLSDEDKVTFIDSLKAARERLLANQPQPATPAPGGTSTTTTGPGGETRTQMTVVVGGGPMSAAGGPMGMNSRNTNFVPPNELPDYKPPFFNGNARPDADGNIWVLTIPTRGIPGGPVYDVINSKGELVERVQVPANRTIVGFGAGGVVYLAARVDGKTTLERAKVK